MCLFGQAAFKVRLAASSERGGDEWAWVVDVALNEWAVWAEHTCEVAGDAAQNSRAVSSLSSFFSTPPPSLGEKRIKRLPRALSRARRSGRKARRVGCQGTLRGEGHLACGSPPSSSPRRCTGGWEECHIGGAESDCGALRCGQMRDHRHRRREARGPVIAGQRTVDGRWLGRDASRR